MREKKQPEPWLRGTHISLPAVLRAVLHALELAREDLEHWCNPLTDSEIHLQPAGLASVAFHLRHIARSADRLLTYAEGNPLSPQQLQALKTEMELHGTTAAIFVELNSRLASCAERIPAFDKASLEQPRTVGRENLPTTVGGLLVHVADHTQRHVGQAITTAKLILSRRGQETIR